MTSLPPSYDYALDLRETRRALGLTQEQMAGYLGISSNTVARRERGEFGKGLNLQECRLALIGLRAILKPAGR